MLQRPLSPYSQLQLLQRTLLLYGPSSSKFILAMCLNSLMEFQQKVNLDFSLNIFRLAFIHLTCFLIGGPSCMVFEHLRDSFDPKDSIGDFSQLFMVCSYVTTRHIVRNIVKALGATRLLALTKLSNGIHLIEVGEVFYWLVSMTLCLQFHDTFLTHLSPHLSRP